MNKNKRIVCADGFTMSVQAHEGAYCTPRISGASVYTEAEVGYPNRYEPLLMQWCEDDTRPCDTVYGYVPRQVIMMVIAKHGGVISGDLPDGIGRITPAA